MISVKECSASDVKELAKLNKQLIDDEKSNNPMSIGELEERMAGFLTSDYSAYFFVDDEDNVIGYALVRNSCEPPYLRQFLIKREYRGRHLGTAAFNALLDFLGVTSIDIEVLSHNTAGLGFWESCGFKEISRYMRFG